jgi:hypothetical protein
MSVSLLLSFWPNRKFTSSRLKLFLFLVASFVGVVLFAATCGLLSALLPDQSRLIFAAEREQVWPAIMGIVAMA